MNYPLCILDGSIKDSIDVILVLDAKNEFARSIHFVNRQKVSCIEELDALCRTHDFTLHQLKACIVVTGNERFTIARLLQVTANALAFAAQVPVYMVSQKPLQAEVQHILQTVSPRTHVSALYLAQPTMN